jgi:hypothetical protein
MTNPHTASAFPMKAARRLLLAGLVALLLGLPLLGLWRVASTRPCRWPVFIPRAHLTGLGRAINGNPLPPLDDVIRLAGGLPRSGFEVSSTGLDYWSARRVHPAASWRFQSVTVHGDQSLRYRLFDDDPTYGITVDTEIHYADGTRRVLRWITWRYGLVLCPFVIPYGDGPPWRVAPQP